MSKTKYSLIQSVIFDKTKYTTQMARNFLRIHKLKPIKRVHTTQNHYRYRIREPKYKKYRTINIHKGVKFVLGIK